jgi:hypothetical protein
LNWYLSLICFTPFTCLCVVALNTNSHVHTWFTLLILKIFLFLFRFKTIGFTKTYLRGFNLILLLPILASTIYSVRVLLNEACKFNDFPLYNVNPNTFLSVSAEFTLVQSYYNLFYVSMLLHAIFFYIFTFSVVYSSLCLNLHKLKFFVYLIIQFIKR